MSELAKPHPIALMALFFVRSTVIAVPDHVPNAKILPVGPENSIQIKKVEGKERVYEARMRSIMNPLADKAYPYSVDMECMAHLTVDDTLNEDEAGRGVFITAHSVLFGAIREAVAWITGRQPYGPLLLGLSVLQPTAPATPEKQP